MTRRSSILGFIDGRMPFTACIGSGLLFAGIFTGSVHAIETHRVQVPFRAFLAEPLKEATPLPLPRPEIRGSVRESRSSALGGLPATTKVVTACSDDGGAGTLRTVIAGAVSGDTIDLRELQCDTITLLGGEIEIFADDIIMAGPGRDALAIDGSDASRIFLHSGRGTLELRDMTLAHGRVIDGNGGCVSSSYGNITLVDTTISTCTVRDVAGLSEYAGGGGAYAVGNITLLRSSIIGNMASAETVRNVGGGGILTRSNQDGVAGNIAITDSLIHGNRVVSTGTGSDVNTYGGGLDSSGTLTIVRSVVSENSVSSASSDAEDESITEGGGVYAFGLSILDSTFRGNSVINSGGAMDVAGGAIVVRGTGVISGSTIEGNHAGMAAGGLVQSGGIPGVSHLELVNSTISHNTAGMYGGGLVIFNEVFMRNSTVAFNSVDESSPFGIGGILLGSNDTTNAYRIQSSIISNNTAGDKAWYGADLAVLVADGKIRVGGSNNLIAQASGAELPVDTLGGDPMLLSLADNGGLTRTHALAEGSPAIDAGNNTAALEFDQRGGYYVRTFGAATDIGAFEAQPLPDVIFRGSFDP